MYENQFFRLIENSDLRKMREFQTMIAASVTTESEEVGELYGVDVAYRGEKAVGAIASMKEEKYLIRDVPFPYVSTYFAFRELPIVWDLVKECDGCILFDGNGMLHPYRAGLATVAGVVLEKQTIGVAKTLLCGEVRDAYVYEDDEIIGSVIRRTKRPIYVSVGNKISLEEATRVVRETGIHRIPDVVRKAYILATRIARRR
jgi:deoxyribonuclease V